jgi:Adenylate and Guanylate cyclase catalytic domain
VQDETATVELGGQSFSCGLLYQSGRDGSIPAEFCSTVQEAIRPHCPCVKANQDTPIPTEDLDKWDVKNGVFKFDSNNRNATAVPKEFGQAPYAPMYSVAYRTHAGRQPLYNVFDDPVRARALSYVMMTGEAAMTEMREREGPYYQYSAEFMGYQTSDLYYPVYSDVSKPRRVVGAIGLEYLWRDFAAGAVPANSGLVSLVIENTCGQAHTYTIDPTQTRLKLRGTTDAHESKYDDMVHSTTFDDYDVLLRASGSIPSGPHCSYRFLVYPTKSLEREYLNNDPIVYCAVAGVIFIFSSLVFFFYDTMVRRRQRKVMASAKRSNNIVSSLFPENVRERLYERAAATDLVPHAMRSEYEMRSRTTAGLNLFSSNSNSVFGSDPIADFFPHTTIMFLDIAGFTAWSSEREPSQVFTLLENIYHAFDEVANQLGVFKVETIGDSYVAVAGLPKPRKDHAVGKFKIACNALE